MTEFAKAWKRLEEISSSLDIIEKNGCGAQHEVNNYAVELHGDISHKIAKFRSRLEDPDPSRRTYGPTMEPKVRECIKTFDDMVQRIGRLTVEVVEKCPGNIGLSKAEEEEQRQRALLEEQAKNQERAAKRRQKEAEQLRIRQLQEAAAREQLEAQQIFLRRQERERAQWVQRELEARQALHMLHKQGMQALQDRVEQRRKREEARDEKRRRLGTILEQHRQVKEKGERQLIAEAIAMSLKEPSGAIEESHTDPEQVSSESKGATAEAKRKESTDVPPAPDLETEETLIKQAIELSLQLSPPLADHCSGNSRRDKTPDAQSP